MKTQDSDLFEHAGEIRPCCRHCGGDLTKAREPRCPECLVRFDPADSRTWTSPMFLRWKFWLPGIVMAMVSGFALLVLAAKLGSFGYGLAVAVPVSVGITLGYAVRVRVLVLALVATTVALGLILGLISFSLAGILCGLVMGVMTFGQLLVGVFAGYLLRLSMKRTRFDQRWFLPLLILFVVSAGIIVYEHFVRPELDIESVRTQREFDLSADEVWQSLAFYEEVSHDPPMLARIGLPRPLRTEGEPIAVGSRKRCVYSTGHLVKRMTDVRPAERLNFEVIEQHHIEDRSIRLIRGGFQLDRLGPHRTRVTLTTVYEPLLAARPFWRPFEYALAHVLHEHVLDGIEGGEVDPDRRYIVQRRTR